jgi:hypothetical protein
MWTTIAGFLSIAGMLFKLYLENKAKKEAKTYENDKAKFNEALVNNDTDMLSGMFDELRIQPESESDLSGSNDKTTPEWKL